MKDCSRWHATIAQDLAGEAEPADLAALAEHCRSCPDCRSLCAVDEDLRGAAKAVQPDAAGLAEVRRAVLRQARLEASAAPATPLVPWRALPALIAAAALLVLVGFLAGRGARVRLPAAAQEVVAREVGRAALADDARVDPLDSPFIYSNVRLEDISPGRLRLGFDVSAHLELDRSADDPLVAEVVSQALLAGTSPVGSRLKAVTVAARLSDRRVRGALLRALHDDPSPAVRLGALAVLARDRGDPVVESAALRALVSEPSVQIRLLAVDYLTGSGVDRATLRHAAESATGAMRAAMLARIPREDSSRGAGNGSAADPRRASTGGKPTTDLRRQP